MAEWSKALDWNSSNILTGVRGFESHLLRQIPEPSLMLGFFMRQYFELCTNREADGGSLLLIGVDPDSPMMFLND